MVRYKQLLTKFKTFGDSSHELSSIYLKQVGASTLIKGISVLVSLIYVPLVLGFLDQEKYGIWVTLTTVVNWISVLDIGMGNGLRNKLAEAVANKDLISGRTLISTTYAILGGIFIFVLLIFYFVNPLINWQEVLNTQLIPGEELIKLTLVVVSFIILRFIFQTISIVYSAHGNTAMGSLIQLISSIVTLILVWMTTIFSSKGNIIILAWVATGVPVLTYIIFTIIAFSRKYSLLRPNYKLIQIKQSGELFKLSIQFFVVQITATILYSSTPFVVAQLFSPNQVTQFSIASSFFNIPIMIFSLVLAPILPLVTQAFAKNDINWLKETLRKLNYISFVFIVGTIIMIVLSGIIYKIWLGNKVIIPFTLSLAIGVYVMISLIVSPFSIFLNGIGKIRILTFLAPLGIGMFIGLSILLAKLMGDVVSISIALSLTSLVGMIVIPLELRKYKIF